MDDQLELFPDNSPVPKPVNLGDWQQLNVRIREVTMAQLDALAQLQGCSRTAYIRNLIHQTYLDNRQEILTYRRLLAELSGD